jgi:hypothetical protein
LGWDTREEEWPLKGEAFDSIGGEQGKKGQWPRRTTSLGWEKGVWKEEKREAGKSTGGGVAARLCCF